LARGRSGLEHRLCVKRAAESELVNAIQARGARRDVHPSAMTRVPCSKNLATPAAPRENTVERSPPREIEVLRHGLSKGYTTARSLRRCGSACGPSRVMRQLMSKLDVHSRVELTGYAEEHHLLEVALGRSVIRCELARKYSSAPGRGNICSLQATEQATDRYRLAALKRRQRLGCQPVGWHSFFVRVRPASYVVSTSIALSAEQFLRGDTSSYVVLHVVTTLSKNSDFLRFTIRQSGSIVTAE